MNMQKILFILFFFFCSSLHSTESKKEKPYHFCQRIKKIPINASEADYKELAQLFLENDLSVCECAWNLVKEKKQKALTRLKSKNYLTQESISKIEKFIKQEKLACPINLIVHIPEDFSPELIKEIGSHFSPNFFVEFREDNCTKPTGVIRDVLLERTMSSSEKNPEFSIKPQSTFHLNIDVWFKREKSLSRKGILLHEEQHIYSDHDLETYLLKIETLNQLNIDKIPKDNKEYNKLTRAHETEADIIPGACGDSLECAAALSECHLTTISPHNYDATATHPTTYVRQIWARRIYKLRKAEEELKNQLIYNKIYQLLPPLYC